MPPLECWNNGILEYWVKTTHSQTPVPHLHVFFTLSFHIIPLFHHSSIPSVCSIIPVERCLPTGHLFAFVEVIQSISTIGFRPCNGARLTLHILSPIFGPLACSFHSMNEIHHTSQEQCSNGSDTPSSSFGSNPLQYFSIYCVQHQYC